MQAPGAFLVNGIPIKHIKPISYRKMSVCTRGCSDGDNVPIASSSILLTKIESGVVPIFHFTTIPSKQSIIGDRYTFPEGMANSVMSVNHF